MNHKIPVIVGMSGGVDSAVAALQLQKAGYAVEGLFMKNWEEDDDEQYCAATEDLADAQAVCNQLGIHLHSVNFSSEYWDNVFEYFLAEYRAGRTPNPDIMCNKEIKFKAFLEHALRLGANYIATGHYARINIADKNYQLLTGLDNHKDQSYFLYTLGQKQLSHSLFPLGDMQKSDVRKIAAEVGFVNHAKKDSTGICFIGERKFSEFLNRFIPAQPGDIVTPDGQAIGTHNGLMFFTLGQRQGLGIGGVKNADESPWFVVDKDLQNNQLIVAQGHNHPLLLHSTLYASQLHWISGKPPQLPMQCTARIRYRQSSQPCTLLSISHDQLEIIFNQPQRAITPGQSVVIYRDEKCLGGGIIERFDQ
jgi:tRNA-specific 2-thiouridylase